jgi:hypothetical protein
MSSRGALGFILFGSILVLPGCDEPPDCRLQVGISGATEGAAEWSLVGEDKCGFISTASLGTSGAAISFSKGSDQFILVIDTLVPDVGLYVGEAIFLSGGFIWQSPAETCSVMITEFEFEGWSLRDFISIKGTFQCEQPLVATDPMVDDLVLSTLAFEGHLYDELVSAPNL